MTVKELFNSLTFDEVAEALRYTHSGDRSVAKCMAAYKESFDYFRHLDFKGDGGEVTFDVMPRKEWFTPGLLPLLAKNVEGDYWENTVGKTIVYPQDNPFSDAQLAGAILWGMTFYGFTPRNLWRFTEKCNSRYGIKANILIQRQYRPYIRDKFDLKLLRQYAKQASIDREMLEVAFTDETWDRIHYRQQQGHQNRSKRKRFYRISKRIDDLRRIDRRIGLIEEISADIGEDNVAKIYSQIMSASEINEYIIESRAYGAMSRSAYISELATKYGLFDKLSLKVGDRVIVIYTSSSTCLIDCTSEVMPITELLMGYARSIGLGADCISSFIGTDNTENGEMALRILVVDGIGTYREDAR